MTFFLFHLMICMVKHQVNCFHIHQTTPISQKKTSSTQSTLIRRRNPTFMKYASFKPLSATTTSSESTSTGGEKISDNMLEPPDQIKMLQIPAKDCNDDTYSFPYVLNFTRVDTYDTPIHLQIHRISNAPHIFLINNLISERERITLCHAAQSISSFSSTPLHGNIRKEVADTVSSIDSNCKDQDGDYFSAARPNSTVYWISPNLPQNTPETEKKNHPEVSCITQALMRASASLLLSPQLFQTTQQSSSKSNKQQFSFLGCEDLQMVHYTKDGEFLLHQDGLPRVLTVLFYLNGVAGTWFPLARTSKEKEESKPPSNILPLNKRQAMQMIHGYIPGERGILISSAGGFLEHEDSYTEKHVDESQHVIPIQAGDAIAFYNYLDPQTLEDGKSYNFDQMYGQLDWRAIHAGLPTDSNDKWIATLWFLVKPSK